MTRKDNKEASHAVERQPGQILERHDLAEDSAIYANLKVVPRPSPTMEHYGCPMMNDDGGGDDERAGALHARARTHIEALPGPNPARIPVITFMLMNATDQSDLIKIMIKEKRSVIAVTLTT